MKKMLFSSLLLISLTLSAQDEKPIHKGNLLVGGGASFGYGSELLESGSGSINLSLNPSIGFFVGDGFALGLSPSFGLSADLIDSDYNSLNAGMGFFLAGYFNFGLFIRGTVGYDLDRYTYSYYDYYSGTYSDTNTTHAVYFIPEVGFAFFLGPNVALELSLKDRVRLQMGDDTYLFSRTYIAAGFQIFL